LNYLWLKQILAPLPIKVNGAFFSANSFLGYIIKIHDGFFQLFINGSLSKRFHKLPISEKNYYILLIDNKGGSGDEHVLYSMSGTARNDLTDLEQLLEQTQGTGVDVYTHSEMLPAHYYPAFKKYDNFVGNYGNAWWRQDEEFESFNGPVLFTTNCIVPPENETVKSRIFTTGVCGYPGCNHIETDSEGKKDFSPIIALAKTLPAPVEIESGSIVGGFAHNQVMALADKVVEAVKSGAIKKFFVMAGCDGRMQSREYYTEFARKLPKDTVILTAGCANTAITSLV
jgi:hydroxylamine reductase